MATLDYHQLHKQSKPIIWVGLNPAIPTQGFTTVLIDVDFVIITIKICNRILENRSKSHIIFGMLLHEQHYIL